MLSRESQEAFEKIFEQCYYTSFGSGKANIIETVKALHQIVDELTRIAKTITDTVPALEVLNILDKVVPVKDVYENQTVTSFPIRDYTNSTSQVVECINYVVDKYFPDSEERNVKVTPSGYEGYNLGMFIAVNRDTKLIWKYLDLLELIQEKFGQNQAVDVRSRLIETLACTQPISGFNFGNILARKREILIGEEWTQADKKLGNEFNKLLDQAQVRYIMFLMRLFRDNDNKNINNLLLAQETTTGANYGLSLAQCQSDYINLHYIALLNNADAALGLISVKDNYDNHYGLVLCQQSKQANTIRSFICVLEKLARSGLDKASIIELLDMKNTFGKSFYSVLSARLDKEEVVSQLRLSGFMSESAEKVLRSEPLVSSSPFRLRSENSGELANEVNENSSKATNGK